MCTQWWRQYALWFHNRLANYIYWLHSIRQYPLCAINYRHDTLARQLHIFATESRFLHLFQKSLRLQKYGTEKRVVCSQLHCVLFQLSAACHTVNAIFQPRYAIKALHRNNSLVFTCNLQIGLTMWTRQRNAISASALTGEYESCRRCLTRLTLERF